MLTASCYNYQQMPTSTKMPEARLEVWVAASVVYGYFACHIHQCQLIPAQDNDVHDDYSAVK
jgi:hypothetical protein